MNRNFVAPYPARSALGSERLALGARVEFEGMSVVPQTGDVHTDDVPMCPVAEITGLYDAPA